MDHHSAKILTLNIILHKLICQDSKDTDYKHKNEAY